MRISIFAGDLCDVEVEALCTSTNPRLSLAMGTGSSVRDRGGYQILRECETIVEAELLRSGLKGLSPGSVHVTGAGDLNSKVIVHCVASDDAHRSSPAIIRSCVINALARADETQCESIAMPVFAAGHAGFRFESALTAMAEALRDTASAVQRVFIVVYDPDRAHDARRIIRSVIPGCEVDVRRGPKRDDSAGSMWSAGWRDDDGW
jgi:O-acetyl-ADP-ribose deacetylase (regulator of RNase III)